MEWNALPKDGPWSEMLQGTRTRRSKCIRETSLGTQPGRASHGPCGEVQVREPATRTTIAGGRQPKPRPEMVRAPDAFPPTSQLQYARTPIPLGAIPPVEEYRLAIVAMVAWLRYSGDSVQLASAGHRTQRSARTTMANDLPSINAGTCRVNGVKRHFPARMNIARIRLSLLDTVRSAHSSRFAIS